MPNRAATSAGRPVVAASTTAMTSSSGTMKTENAAARDWISVRPGTPATMFAAYAVPSKANWFARLTAASAPTNSTMAPAPPPLTDSMTGRNTPTTLSVVGIFLPVMLAASGGGGAMTLFVGALAAISLANQFGFEGTAYAANIVAGVPGRTEIQSRAAAFSVFIVPLLLVIAVVLAATTGQPADVAARFGTMLAAYGIGLAVVLPISVRAAYSLPDTTNPFAMSNGAGLTKGLMTLGALAVAVVGTVPLLLAGYLAEDVWRWIGLPVALVYGGAAYTIGARLAGNLLDRRMPEVLAAVTPNR